jgi:DNA-binding MarR family transcriptional regulator
MKQVGNKTETREQLIKKTVSASMDLFVMMQSAAVAHWLMFELTFAQAKALILLAANKSLTVSHLGRLLNVGNPTASTLVQQLVERGLVTRTEDEADRRQTLVQLSEKGAEIGAGRRSEREKQWQRWLVKLSDEELSALARGLGALQAVAQAEAQSESDTSAAED